jgi:hypothetical protein
MRVSKRDTLDRYYLFRIGRIGFFLHWMHTDELADVFHSHPWSWVSFILGGYLEERLGEKPRMRWFFNSSPAERQHRVTLPRGPVWSLLIHGRRKNRWKVVHRSGHVLATEPWKGTGPRTPYFYGMEEDKTAPHGVRVEIEERERT